MWCLKGRKGFCVYILPNQKKSFGKSLSDIKLEGDATISRLHAVVSVEPTEDSEVQYKCVINDVSKYGTFVIRDKKTRKLSSHDKFILKAGDIVQFGLKESTFVVLCHSFIIAKSSLNEQEVEKLKDIVSDLKATLTETWDNFCTHLTVAESTLFTTKLACALACAKPIITNAYWEAVNVAVKESKELPEIEDFLPRVKEEWLTVHSKIFLPNEKRKTLFKGLSFVHFCAKQYFAHAPLIIAAGGKSCVYPTKRPLTPRDLTAKNAIVIQQPVSDSSQLTQAIAADYSIIYHKLQTVNRRMISDTEIPLAILYCNAEKYCNPKYNFSTFLKLETPDFLSSETMIENTPDIVNTDTRQIKRKVIPETCESQNNENVSKKIRFDKNERNISDTNESNIATIQNIDKKESKCKIIPETCDSPSSNKISKSSYSFYESESKYMSGTNESDIAINMQDTDKEMKCEIIDKISDSQSSKNISKEFFNESEQRYVSNMVNISNHGNKQCQIIPDSCCSVEKNIDNIIANHGNKQCQIIPDSCCSVENNINDIFSGKNNSKKAQIIFETCEYNEFVGNNFTTEKQRNIKLQEKEILEEYNVPFKNQEKNMKENEYRFQQQENSIINEKKIIFEKNNLDRQKNSIIEKDNLNYNNSKFPIVGWEKSKNAKTPHTHTVAIKEVNDSKIDLKQEKENLFEEGCTEVKLKDFLKDQELNPICSSEKNQEDKRVNKNKMQTKDNKKEEFRLIRGNECLNQGFTDKILRKDVPCGKKFIKMFVKKPDRILRMDDFVL